MNKLLTLDEFWECKRWKLLRWKVVKILKKFCFCIFSYKITIDLNKHMYFGMSDVASWQL